MSAPPHPHVLMTTDAVGGVWTYASTLAQALCRRGYRVSLVSLGPAPRADQSQALRGFPGLELMVTELALEWQDPAGADTARAAEALRDIERKIAPDLIHLNGYREASAGWQAPTVVAAHSCVGSWWQACRGGEPTESIWRLYTGAVRAGLRRASAWIAPTAAYRDDVQRRYAPFRAGRVIYNGIGPVRATGIKQPFILAAGRLWDEAKNTGLLAAIAAQLDWPVQLAGRFGQHRPLSPTAGVTWLGELPHPALQARMQAAAVFASPALYEPFGLTVLEAAAAGCALVLSDIASFRELWNGAALFVDPRDERGMAHALNRVARDAGLRKRLQAAAARRAGTFSLNRTVDDTARLYATVLSNRAHLAQSPAELCA